MLTTKTQIKRFLARLFLRCPLYNWATETVQEELIQIFEGDDVTAKSWHLSNQCPQNSLRPQLLPTSLCLAQMGYLSDDGFYETIDHKQGVQ